MKHTDISTILITLFAAVLCFGPVGLAEPLGSAFTYQGRLDDAGTPVTGTYDFRFMLYDAAAGGTQQGITVIKENVQVTNGIFMVEIDPANGNAGVFNGDSRWLEISLRDGASTGSFSILSPRQRLAPAPYAVRSISGGGGGTADLALNLTCSECVSAEETDFYNGLALAAHRHYFEDIDCSGCVSAEDTDFYDGLALAAHKHYFEDIEGSANNLTVTGNVTIGTRLDVNGPIYQRGAVLHADYVFEAGYKLESIDEHSEFMWQEKHLPAMPKIQKDENGREIVEIGARSKGIVEELEKAHIYIEQLHKENKELRDRLERLDARLDAMRPPVAESSPQQEE